MLQNSQQYGIGQPMSKLVKTHESNVRWLNTFWTLTAGLHRYPTRSWSKVLRNKPSPGTRFWLLYFSQRSHNGRWEVSRSHWAYLYLYIWAAYHKNQQKDPDYIMEEENISIGMNNIDLEVWRKVQTTIREKLGCKPTPGMQHCLLNFCRRQLIQPTLPQNCSSMQWISSTADCTDMGLKF